MNYAKNNNNEDVYAEISISNNPVSRITHMRASGM
jgi:hypothetical protein